MSFCQGVRLLYPGQEIYAFPSGLIVTITSIFGFLLGLIATILLFKEFHKSKVQKSGKPVRSRQRVVHSWDGTEEDGVHFVSGGAQKTTATYQKMQKDKKKKKAPDDEVDAVSYKDETRSMTSNDTMEEYHSGSISVSFTGIVSVLTKSGLQSPKMRDRAMEDLSIQDVRDSWALQTETQTEKTSIFVLLLHTLLGKFVTSERVTKTYVEEFISEYHQMILERQQGTAAGLTQLERDLRKSGKSGIEIEEELEMKRPEYSRKMVIILESCEVKMREELQLNSGLNEDEIEALFEKLHKYMTMTEKMIGQTLDEQSAVLQDRLSKRQALAQQCADLSSRESRETQTRVTEMKKTLAGGVEDQQMTRAQMERILKDYESNVKAADENYKKELERQSRDLTTKLQSHREAAIAKMRDKQAKDKEKLEQAAPQVVNPSDIVQAYHDMSQQHRTESNDMIAELDYNEAQAVGVLRRKLAAERKEETEGMIEGVIESLAEETEMTKKEAKNMMQKYQAHCEAHQEALTREKERQSEALQRRMVERKAAWEMEKEKERVDQEQLTRQQDTTVNKVLDSQAALDEEAKKRILMQHEKNMVSMKNHLQLTRMRQRKLVEARLAKRKARIEAIKEKQMEEEDASSTAPDQDERENLQTKHDDELASELAEYKEEERRTLDVFRSKMVLETSEMLKTQDQRMGRLLGKLQVGQARRRNIIEKQDKAIQELQEKLVDTVGEGDRVPGQRTEQIVAKHLREVEEVEDKLKQAREHQARVLQQKYETQKLLRERSILAKLEENKKKNNGPPESKLSMTDKKPKRSALGVLTRIYEDSRQEQALKQLEQEMRSEMMQQKQDLNRELEEAMQRELEEREKDFLGDLAAISELRNEELTDMVSTAVQDTGGDQSEAKLIKKDLIKRIKKAKSDQEESGAEPTPRKKKGKGKKKK